MVVFLIAALVVAVLVILAALNQPCHQRRDDYYGMPEIVHSRRCCDCASDFTPQAEPPPAASQATGHTVDCIRARRAAQRFR